MYGKDWKRVKKVIKTRNLQQISAHCDRFIRKLKKTPSLVSRKLQQILLGNPSGNPQSLDNKDKEQFSSQSNGYKNSTPQKESHPAYISSKEQRQPTLKTFFAQYGHK